MRSLQAVATALLSLLTAWLPPPDKRALRISARSCGPHFVQLCDHPSLDPHKQMMPNLDASILYMFVNLFLVSLMCECCFIVLSLSHWAHCENSSRTTSRPDCALRTVCALRTGRSRGVSVVVIDRSTWSTRTSRMCRMRRTHMTDCPHCRHCTPRRHTVTGTTLPPPPPLCPLLRPYRPPRRCRPSCPWHRCHSSLCRPRHCSTHRLHRRACWPWDRGPCSDRAPPPSRPS